VLRAAAVVVSLVIAGVVAFNAVTFALAFARGPRPPKLWRALAKEILSGLLLIPLWPLWWVLGEAYEVKRGHGRPVVLLHGYAMNRTNWLWLGPKLAKMGVGPLYGAGYWSLDPVAVSAQRLKNFVERLRARLGVSRVDVVAHSLGGLIARYYIEHLGGAQAVAKLVTIATPHRGTRMAVAAVGYAARDLAHDSALIAELATVRRPHDVPYVSVWSTCDNLVVPAESAKIAPSGEDVVFDDLGHLGLLVSPRVAEVVAQKLVDN
jgi:triacylglycerol lipase